ncbi:MAG: hypothetical protein R3F20_01720 [Planctomycetota bacterium]
MDVGAVAGALLVGVAAAALAGRVHHLVLVGAGILDVILDVVEHGVVELPRHEDRVGLRSDRLARHRPDVLVHDALAAVGEVAAQRAELGAGVGPGVSGVDVGPHLVPFQGEGRHHGHRSRLGILGLDEEEGVAALVAHGAGREIAGDLHLPQPLVGIGGLGNGQPDPERGRAFRHRQPELVSRLEGPGLRRRTGRLAARGAGPEREETGGGEAEGRE